MATDAQDSGPLPTETFTLGRWRQIFGAEPGIVGDTDGSAFGLTLPPSSDTAEVGSTTLESIAIIGGHPLIIPAGTTQSIDIPASTNPTIGRTDIIAARWDPTTFNTDPGPVRLVRIGGTEGSAALPPYSSPLNLPLWAITRKQGKSLTDPDTGVRDLRTRTGRNYRVADGGVLPQDAPLGATATRAGAKWRRDIVGSSVDWVQEWMPSNGINNGGVYDTNWINLVMKTGWKATTGYTPQVRRIGAQVYIRGRVETLSGDNASGSHTPCNIPDTALGNSCKPPQNHDYVQLVVTGGAYRIWVATNGTINVAGFPAASDLYIATNYAVN